MPVSEGFHGVSGQIVSSPYAAQIHGGSNPGTICRSIYYQPDSRSGKALSPITQAEKSVFQIIRCSSEPPDPRIHLPNPPSHSAGSSAPPRQHPPTNVWTLGHASRGLTRQGFRISSGGTSSMALSEPAVTRIYPRGVSFPAFLRLLLGKFPFPRASSLVHFVATSAPSRFSLGGDSLSFCLRRAG